MKMFELLKQKWSSFCSNFHKNFMRWTPAFALVFGVLAIGGLTVAQAMVHSGGWRIAYLATGAFALLMLAVCLWPVRRAIPHILGLEAEFPSMHNKNETRRS